MFKSYISISGQKQSSEVFSKKGVKNFAKFTGKHQCESLLFNFVKFNKKIFFIEHLQWLLLFAQDFSPFSLSRFSFTDTNDWQDSRGEWEDHFYSSLALSPAHEHPDIYLQVCMWDDYHALLIASFVITRLLFVEIYHFGELPFDWLMKDL